MAPETREPRDENMEGVRLGICIPTINRGDLLAESMASLIAQESEFQRVLIIDNGNQQLPFRHPKVEIVEPGKNLGVAASWNLGVRKLFEDPELTHVLTLNDDIVLGAHQMGAIRLDIAQRKNAWFFAGPYYWSVWAIARRGVEEVLQVDGYLFDENFFPAYYEDNDFYHRFTSRFPERYEGELKAFEPEIKRNSASAALDSSLTIRFGRNGEYYLCKWGGMPGSERRHPDVPLTIGFCYERHCARRSDINEHLPALRELAGLCAHVTEMGVRTAVSTWAFLCGHPRRLVSYDLEWHPNLALAAQAARDAGIDFEFHEEDVLTAEIEETDLLFIDTLHTYAQLRRELHRHSPGARKCIVMHDTVSYGYRDEVDDGEVLAKRGLVTAIVDFLDSPEGQPWEHYGTDIGNNGLTVLVRKEGGFDPPLE